MQLRNTLVSICGASIIYRLLLWTQWKHKENSLCTEVTEEKMNYTNEAIWGTVHESVLLLCYVVQHASGLTEFRLEYEGREEVLVWAYMEKYGYIWVKEALWEKRK